MKSTKYIILGIVIISMTMGTILNTLGQGTVRFVETYKSSEVTKLLENTAKYFKLVNTNSVAPENANLGTCNDSDSGALWAYLHAEEIQSRLPEELRFAWGWNSEDGKQTIFALKESKEYHAPEKKDIQSVILKESTNKGSFDLLIEFSEEGAKKWAIMTRENVNRNIAIVVEGKVVTAPKVQMEIKHGKCRISGDFNKEEASEIKRILLVMITS